MTNAPAILVTGASSGLGLALARLLQRSHPGPLILPVRTDVAAAAIRTALGPDAHVATPRLALDTLADVETFLGAFDRDHPALRLGGLMLNAGMQASGGLSVNADGYETSFAVNHLAHHRLLAGLAPRLVPGARVGFTGSGTHDPGKATARLFGFRGGIFHDTAQVARGDFGDVQPAQACRDAYATSKLCNIMSARHFGRLGAHDAEWFAFDPGLMPGTGLARRHPGALRFAWHRLLPIAVPLIPGASTPARSAMTLAGLVLGTTPLPRNGAYIEFSGAELEPSEPARDPALAAGLIAASDRMARLAPQPVAVPA